MIIEMLLNLLAFLVKSIFAPLPSIPGLDSITESIDKVLDIILANLQLLGVFIRPQTVQLIIPVLIIIVTFEEVYDLVIWIVKKIPVIGIE